MSLSYVMDFLDICVKIDNDEDIHREEKCYYQMLAILPLIEEKHRSGVISEKRYISWMETFTELEGKYEQDSKRNYN